MKQGRYVRKLGNIFEVESNKNLTHEIDHEEVHEPHGMSTPLLQQTIWIHPNTVLEFLFQMKPKFLETKVFISDETRVFPKCFL